MNNPLGCARGAVAAACMLLCASLSSTSLAQTAPPAEAGAASASERASREGDKVFKWILMHSDKPRKAAKDSPVATAAPAPAAKEVAARPETKAPVAATPAEAPRALARAEAKHSATAGASTTSQGGKAMTTATAPSGTVPSASAAAAPENSTVASALPTAPAALPDIPAPPEEDYEEPLVLAKQIDPEFPGTLMRALRKGSVQVKFTVQPDGSVGPVEVVKTSSVRLNNAATAAVAQWRFMPIRHPQAGIVELGFNLD